jgi:hypothetical protein
MLGGARSVTLKEARDIVIEIGREPDTTLLLLIYCGDDLEWLWREPKTRTFMSELLGAIPNALRNRLGEQVEELRPGWGARAAKRAVSAVGRMVDDRLTFVQAFGLTPIPKLKRKPRRRPVSWVKAL